MSRNPFKRHCGEIRPSRRATRRRRSADLDMQSIVNRRLASRFGLSAATAAVIASLAGLGPRTERVGR